MAMSKFLDYTRLTYFWGKVEAYITNKLATKVNMETGKGTFVAIASNQPKYAIIKLNPCVNGVSFLLPDKSN